MDHVDFKKYEDGLEGLTSFSGGELFVQLPTTEQRATRLSIRSTGPLNTMRTIFARKLRTRPEEQQEYS